MYKSTDEILEIIDPIADLITMERIYTGRWKVVIVDNKTLSRWVGNGKTLPEALFDAIVFINTYSEILEFNINDLYKKDENI